MMCAFCENYDSYDYNAFGHGIGKIYLFNTFTLKMSDALQITRGICHQKSCLDKLVKMCEELEKIHSIKDKTTVIERYTTIK